jgi:uncharacterized protein
MNTHPLALVSITLFAALVNGALGYGFSSITVPLALLFLANRILNPALVLIEVALNTWVIVVNREALPRVWPRVLPIIVGLLPGVAAGTIIVSRVAPTWLKLGTYLALLPFVLVQAAGFRRPVRAERTVGLPFGAGIGMLYSVTTISGPPLAMAFNNQGFAKTEFRAALGLVRLGESSFTALAYLAAGLFTRDSIGLIPQILPSVLVGVPLGVLLIHRIAPEVFRRWCTSLDAWVVGFGISVLLHDLHLMPGASAFLVVALVAVMDGALLYRFFARRRAVDIRSPNWRISID